MRRHLVGFIAAASLLAVLLTAGTLLAGSLPPTAKPYRTHVRDGGLAELVKGSQYIKNWDCGCPPLEQRPSVKKSWVVKVGDKTYRWNKNTYPSRCLADNAPEQLESARGSDRYWRPYNNRGEQWPEIQYPDGFPKDSKDSRHPGTYDVIPFAGWPKYRKYDKSVVWDDTARSDYRDWYAKKGTVPADPTLKNPPLPADTAKVANTGKSRMKYRPGWTFYQIHHIFERRFGGQNNYANLVPVYSRRGTNLHQRFTTWWTNAVVDGDLAAKPRAAFQTCLAE